MNGKILLAVVTLPVLSGIGEDIAAREMAYRDFDATTGTFSNAVADCQLVTVEAGVTKIGANAWTAFGDGVLINNESIQNRKLIADGFAPASPESPSGYITPADPNAIRIADGKVYLGVSVATNAVLEVEKVGGGGEWGSAKIEAADLDKETGTVTLTVPAPAEKGFMILKTKGK